MQNLAASPLQTTQNAPVLPVYSGGSMWQHMTDALHQSFYRVLTLLIAVLPGILAFFVALLVFTLSGVAISWTLRRCLTWLKFDLRLASKGGSDWTPSSSPTEIVARLSFWGVRAARTHHRRLGLRHFVRHRHNPSHCAPALPHACGGRGTAADCGYFDRALPGAVGPDQRCECAIAIRAHSFVGREVAGAGAHGGHGAGPSSGGWKHCRAGVRHSLRRHRSHPRAGGWAWLPRSGQPLAGEPRGTYRRPCARSGHSLNTEKDDPAFLMDRDRQARRQCPAAAQSHVLRYGRLGRDARSTLAPDGTAESMLQLSQVADHADGSAFHAQPLFFFVVVHAGIARRSVVQARSASPQANQGAIPRQHLRVARALRLPPT